MDLADTIKMSVDGLTLDPATKTPIVVLRDADNKINLPIWIGLLEATATSSGRLSFTQSSHCITGGFSCITGGFSRICSRLHKC